jgi:flagellar biosynthesis regulator FlbT
LEVTDPQRQLYIAVSCETYNEVFKQNAYQFLIKRHQLPFIIVNVETEEIVKWTKPFNIAA